MVYPSNETVSVICPNCGKARNVRIYNTLKPTYTGLCRECNKFVGRKAKGKECGQWKGGQHITGDGYRRILLDNDSPYLSMANHLRYVMEHRLVMAKHLGRLLAKAEIVHHLNGIRTDNRLENLTIVTLQTHKGKTLVEILKHRIRELEEHQEEIKQQVDVKWIKALMKGGILVAEPSQLEDISKAIKHEERSNILVEFDTMFFLAPEDNSYLRILVKDLYKAIKAGKWPNAELGQPLKAEKGES